MIEITYILLAVIVLVVLIDLYLKRKNKLATTKEIEKVIDKENPEKKKYKKPVVIVTSILLILIGLFFTVNHLKYDGRLTDTDDGISLLQNIIETQYNISDINFIGDSIYKFNDNTNANGLIYCEYGNIGMLINGKPDGLWTLYHSNGAKKMRVLLINGEQEGIRTDWYNDGSKQFEGNFFDDKQTGICRFWYQNGQNEVEGEFDKGEFAGDYTRWYENGSVKCIYNQQEKTYKEYWDNGNIYIDAHSVTLPLNSLSFSGGNISADFYSRRGELINRIPHTRLKKPYDYIEKGLGGGPCTGKSNCVTYHYYLNDEVKEMSYFDDENISHRKIYYENGRLMFDSKTYERFFRNGMLNFNKIDGQTVSYDEHGIRNENRLFERRKELMY